MWDGRLTCIDSLLVSIRAYYKSEMVDVKSHRTKLYGIIRLRFCLDYCVKDSEALEVAC